MSNVKLDGTLTPTPITEAKELAHRMDITLTATPDRRKWKFRKRYKKCGQAQIDAIVRIQRQLSVLPPP